MVDRSEVPAAGGTPDRPPPAVDRGPRRELGPRAQRLVERAQAGDRALAADERVRAVLAADARLRRRHHATALAGWLVAVVALVGGGWLLADLGGAGAGALVLASVYGAHRLVTGAAVRRGGSAWDWRARRYRLLGNPAAEVQSLDRYGDGRDVPGRPRDRSA